MKYAVALFASFFTLIKCHDDNQVLETLIRDDISLDKNAIELCSTSEDEAHIDLSLNELEQDDPKLINILRDKYLIKPNGKKLNLTSPATKKSLWGQYGQPFVLDDKYFRGKKKKGFFIEAGAFDGEIISNSLYFEIMHQWTGLLVEPNPNFFSKMLSKNRNVWSLGYCLSTKTHPEVVTFDLADVLSGIINPETGASPVSEDYEGQRKTLTLQCFPLYSILMALGNPKVDYLSLDVEGADLEVLKTIPWSKVKISTVGVEMAHLGTIFPGSYSDLIDLMETNGYELLEKMEIDVIFAKKKKKKKELN